MKKRYLFFLSVLLIGLSLFVVKKYILVSEKNRVVKTMRLAEHYLEKKDAGNFMRQISMTYQDNYGYTWATLFFYVKSILSYYDNIKISLSQVSIEIEGHGKDKKALVRFLAVVEAKTLIGEIVKDMGSFSAEMKKDGSRWKVTWFGENPYSFY